MDGARWLDDDEQQTWRTFIDMVRLLSSTLDRELQRDRGIPHGYYEILVMLSEAPAHTLRMSELAEKSLSSRSRLSHAVTRLEEAGWIERRSCPTDRRGAFAVLTDKGFGALEAAAPGHVGSVRHHIFDRLTPAQVEQLAEISAAIRQGLQADGHTGGGVES